MGALLTLPISLLNLLLPFTRPCTPLLQDLAHTAVLCGTLYFAPQIAEWHKTRQHQQHHEAPPGEPETDAPQHPGTEPPPQPHVDPPLDERLVLQPSDDEDTDNDDNPAIPPPLAPTPPNLQNVRAPPLPQHHEPGPANNAPRPARTIGAKKAKSLARKDQRRAYHEFHRQEAELRRLAAQEGAEERESEAAAARARRAAVESEIAAKEKEERVRRKEEQQREIDEENDRRERVLERVRREVRQRGCVDLLAEARREGKDRMWVLKLVRASGIMGQVSGEGSKALITGDGWLVRVDQDIMAQAYRDAEAYGARNGGRIGFEKMGGFMERAVRARARAKA